MVIKNFFSGTIALGPNITADNDDAIIVQCNMAINPNYNFYTRIGRIDSDGNLLWKMDIHPTMINNPETIITDRENNYITIIDSITDCHTCLQDRISYPIVNMIDKNGKIVLEKKLDSDNGRNRTSIAAIDNGNNIVIAYEPGKQKSSFYEDSKVALKMDNSGKVMRKTTLTQAMFTGKTSSYGGFDKMREIAIDSQNNIYIVGYINEDIFFGPYRLAIAKLNAQGVVVQTKIFKDDYEYWGISIKSLNTNKLVVLSWKFHPYQMAVCYVDADLNIL